MIHIRVIVMLLLSFKQSFGIEVNITKKNPKSEGSLYSVHFDRKLQMTIPDDCANLDFCEEIPDFPEDEISKLIDLLIADNVHFNQDHETNVFSHKEKDDDEDIKLCRSKSTFLQPKAVKVDDDWHLVINSKYKIVQWFRGEECMNPRNGSCSKLVNFNTSYSGHCIQKRIKRRVIVLSKNYDEVIALPQSLPSCCSCMAFPL